MTTLRENIQNSLNELQQLLNQTQDDDSFDNAVKEKWPDSSQAERIFVKIQRPEAESLGSERGRPSGTERDNVAVSKYSEEP